MNLNPAGLARFTDWATTLPLRPLPRTVAPVPGEYHLDYVRSALRAGAWTPRQRQRLHQLDPGTWPQAAPGPGWQYNLSGNPVIEIAIYPDVIRLAAHTLRAHSASDDTEP